jgi:hypothetical protein
MLTETKIKGHFPSEEITSRENHELKFHQFCSFNMLASGLHACLVATGSSTAMHLEIT